MFVPVGWPSGHHGGMNAALHRDNLYKKSVYQFPVKPMNGPFNVALVAVGPSLSTR